MPISLVDLCLSGTQVYNANILIRALTRLTNLEHLRLNGLATITDESLDKVGFVCLINFENNFFLFCEILDPFGDWSTIKNTGNEWLYNSWIIN
jgi:hypothetical protein